MWRAISAGGLLAGVALIATPIISLVYLLTAQASASRLADFGISCSPSTALLTFLYVAGTVTFQLLIGIWAALAVFFWANDRPRRLLIALAILTIPYAIPSTIGLTMFEFLLADGSTIQHLLFPGGSPLVGTWSRFGVMVLLGVWQFFPFIFLLVYAAFLAVPAEMLASARSDGASPVHLVRSFLLPAALPVIVAAATMRVTLMLTKLDAPLAFRETSSNDFACLASVRIYTSLGFGGLPLGMILLLCLIVLMVLLAGQQLANRIEP